MSKTTYRPVKSHDRGVAGTQDIYSFENGYGASVVRGPYTYGGHRGLFELGVLGPNGGLTYDTPITNDVLGYLTEDDVQATLAQIEALPAVTA